MFLLLLVAEDHDVKSGGERKFIGNVDSVRTGGDRIADVSRGQQNQCAASTDSKFIVGRSAEKILPGVTKAAADGHDYIVVAEALNNEKSDSGKSVRLAESVFRASEIVNTQVQSRARRGYLSRVELVYLIVSGTTGEKLTECLAQAVVHGVQRKSVIDTDIQIGGEVSLSKCAHKIAAQASFWIEKLMLYVSVDI